METRADKLESKLESPGFTPRARDVDPLLSFLATASDEDAKRVERALARAGERAARGAMERFSDSLPPFRARLCNVVGRVFAAGAERELGDWLVQRLEDADSKTRRFAASALAKTRDSRFEAPLLAALDVAQGEPDRRALAAALGAVGRQASVAALSALKPSNSELERVVREAKAKIERTLLRVEPSSVLLDALPSRPVQLLLHVRPGLEELLIDEIGERFHPRLAGRGRVSIRLDVTLREVFRARTFLHVGFPLEGVRVRGGDRVDGVVQALTSDAAFEILSTFTRGPIRYRLDWADAGRQRAATFAAAGRVAARRPRLVNDPTAAVWEAVVSETGDAAESVVRVELWPRAIDDPRFSYRKRTLPASSHPTVAAALARIAGVVPIDVVWDPFVGAGTELIERARIGPYGALYGTDIDPRAIDAAGENLRAAGVSRVHLEVGDSRQSGPRQSPTLVLSNPPFGKRVRTPDLIPLLGAVLGNVARRMAQGGRLVWVSPAPGATAAEARRLGFSVDARIPVDLGGVHGEIQKLVLRRGAGGGSRRKL